MFAENDVFVGDGVASTAERLNYRYDKLFEPVKDYFQDATVLDIGCHNGRWCWVSLMLGAKKVVGFEIDENYIAKAQEKFALKHVSSDRYEFRKQDINYLDANFHKGYDIVLCMGVLYYLQDPARLVRFVSAIKPKLAIFDTFAGPLRGGNVPHAKTFEGWLKNHFLTKRVAVYDENHRVSFHCIQRATLL